MKENQPREIRAVPHKADPIAVKRAFEEFREAMAQDVRTNKHSLPPAIPTEWLDGFPYLHK